MGRPDGQGGIRAEPPTLCGWWCALLLSAVWSFAGLHARVIIDGAICRLRELGDVRDVLGVLGVWWRKARERTTKDETWVTPDDNTYFWRTKVTMQFLHQVRCVCVPRL